jgi:hypothetical protein
MLLTDSEPLDQPVIPIGILALQIVEQAPAPGDELQETAAGVVVLRVRLEMVGQVSDPVRQERDLDFGGTRIGIVRAKALHDVRLFRLVRSGVHDYSYDSFFL